MKRYDIIYFVIFMVAQMYLRKQLKSRISNILWHFCFSLQDIDVVCNLILFSLRYEENLNGVTGNKIILFVILVCIFEMWKDRI